jgi:hypothetical protein
LKKQCKIKTLYVKINNMDFASVIGIIIAVAIIYLFIKFVVSPVLRVVFGIIIFLILIYLLQRFFGFNLNQIFDPFGVNLDWLLNSLDYYTDRGKNFLNLIWENFIKNFSKS